MTSLDCTVLIPARLADDLSCTSTALCLAGCGCSTCLTDWIGVTLPLAAGLAFAAGAATATGVAATGAGAGACAGLATIRAATCLIFVAALRTGLATSAIAASMIGAATFLAAGVLVAGRAAPAVG